MNRASKTVQWSQWSFLWWCLQVFVAVLIFVKWKGTSDSTFGEYVNNFLYSTNLLYLYNHSNKILCQFYLTLSFDELIFYLNLKQVRSFDCQATYRCLELFNGKDKVVVDPYRKPPEILAFWLHILYKFHYMHTVWEKMLKDWHRTKHLT